MFKKNSKKILFYSMLLTALFVFISCPMVEEEQIDEKPVLSGYWKSNFGDGFEISGTNYYQYDNSDKDLSFSGIIVNHSDYKVSSGFITIQITNSGSWGMTLNYYYIVRWKNYHVNAASQSCAYKDGGNNSGMSNQTDAETEYTEANGYYVYYGDYLKQ
ncbi:MAG: hypothetical protein JXB50_14615 [Spirochaetes bacterium]|nr:hypothetical protein [Spirochaetota bacterium]